MTPCSVRIGRQSDIDNQGRVDGTADNNIRKSGD
jgi:hypothetical protein